MIGLWRVIDRDADASTPIQSLLLTRRPDLAMWERSKLPQSEEEAELDRTRGMLGIGRRRARTYQRGADEQRERAEMIRPQVERVIP